MREQFSHTALNLAAQKKLIYTAFSKHIFYYRMFISRFVLEQGSVPLNPFMLFDYFLLDSLNRDIIREANNSIVMRADEIWVFGPISNGVLAEILLAKKHGKPLRYYKIDHSCPPIPIEPEDAELEDEVKHHRHLILTNDLCERK